MFLLAMAALSAITAAGAATQGRWISAAVFVGLVINFVVLLIHFRRRRGQQQ